MSARRFQLRLSGFACGGRDVLVQVPRCDVKFCESGVEFRSPFSFPLWVELKVELSLGPGGQPSTRQVVVVACDPAGEGRNRVALLFVDRAASIAGAALANSSDN